MSTLRFEYDERKARANLRKHGVSFAEAISVFDDQLSSTLADDQTISIPKKKTVYHVRTGLPPTSALRRLH